MEIAGVKDRAVPRKDNWKNEQHLALKRPVHFEFSYQHLTFMADAIVFNRIDKFIISFFELKRYS